MDGTVEIFLLPSGQLVFSSGTAKTATVDPSREADYIVLRRKGRSYIPRARILTFPLAEFLNWYYHGLSYPEAFTTLSRRDFDFLASGEIE